MSESSDKLRAFSRREPQNRRQKSHKVPKVQQKKARAANQQRSSVGSAAIMRLDQQSLPPQIAVGAKRSKAGLVVPAVVKPIPHAKGKIPPYNPSTGQIKTVRVPKQPSSKISRRVSRKTRLKPMARTLLYTLRLLIVGVGMGAIVGTLLSILDPATRMAANSSAQSDTKNIGQGQPQPTPSVPVAAASLYLSQEITPLKDAVQNLAATNPNLTPGVFLVDLDTGGYVDVNGTASFPAASTIKVPILVAFFQEVDAGRIRLDEMLTMQQDMVAGGSGHLQYKPAGTQYAALEVATKMITVSDNTATNMLIARLGGVETLNQRFRNWGLTTTIIRNQLPDLSGTNTTSPKELANLMAMLNQGNFVSMRSRDIMLDIMRRTERDNLLPSGLGAGARTYHKTGDISTMLADAGLIDIPNGKRYIAAVMVQRPINDPRAEKLISAISRAAYQQFNQNALTPNTTNTLPTTTYQSPAIGIPPNNTGSTSPATGYQPPAINTPMPNNMGGYSSPITNPQYYPPR